MSKFEVGQKVEVRDGSYSYSFSDKGAKEEHGITLEGEFKVLTTDCKMPIWEKLNGEASFMYTDVPDNDILIKEVATGKIVSIQERFLREIAPIVKPIAKSKFEVGQKVRVRKDLEAKFYGGYFANNEMTGIGGEIGEITTVFNNCYRIQFDKTKHSWTWTDDMLEPVSESKFRVGDWVRVLKSGYNFGSKCPYVDHKPFSQLLWKYPEEGKCYEVVAVGEKQDGRYGYVYALKSKENTICYMHNNYIDGKVAPDGLELTTPPPKFKIGDRVRCVREYDGKTAMVGEIGTVFEYKDKDHVMVKFDKDIKGWGDTITFGHCWSFRVEDGGYDCLEHITEPTAKPAKTEKPIAFKIGDRVRIKEGLCGYYETGDIFYIDRMDSSGAYLRNKQGEKRGYASFFRFKKYIEPQPTPEPIETEQSSITRTTRTTTIIEGNTVIYILKRNGNEFVGIADITEVSDENTAVGIAQARANKARWQSREEELTGRA